MNIHNFDYPDLIDENGGLRALTPEERAEIEALPPDERDELKQQIREAQLLAALNLNMACLDGPPSASGPAFLPPQPEAMLYGPPVGWCAGGFTGMIGAGMTMAEQQKAQRAQEKTAGWRCQCGAEAAGNYCQNCGSPKPEKP